VLSSILLQLIVFFLPTQLGLHFWPDFSRAAGLRVDYLSPTLYLTDLLILLYLVSRIPPILSWLKRHLRPLVILVLFIGLNTVLSSSPHNTLFWWSRFLFYLVFFLSLRLQKITWSQIKNLLLLSTSLVICLEIFQLYHQSSLGGLPYWFGERAFTSSTSGLGRLFLFGLDLVRPQSTFSHPNSLAGYLLIIYYLFHLHRSPLWQRVAIFVGLLLTFSKGALLAFLLVVIFNLRPHLLLIIFTTLSLSQLFLPTLAHSPSFISDRLFFLNPLRKMILRRPLLGVGLGGFIPALAGLLPGSFLLPSKLQPVHNIFLLALSEIGLLGSLLLGWLAHFQLKLLSKPRFAGLLALITITGTFDHYWWTLPQNKLILLLASAILL